MPWKNEYQTKLFQFDAFSIDFNTFSIENQRKITHFLAIDRFLIFRSKNVICSFFSLRSAKCMGFFGKCTAAVQFCLGLASCALGFAHANRTNFAYKHMQMHLFCTWARPFFYGNHLKSTTNTSSFLRESCKSRVNPRESRDRVMDFNQNPWKNEYQISLFPIKILLFFWVLINLVRAFLFFW